MAILTQISEKILWTLKPYIHSTNWKSSLFISDIRIEKLKRAYRTFSEHSKWTYCLWSSDFKWQKEPKLVQSIIYLFRPSINWYPLLERLSGSLVVWFLSEISDTYFLAYCSYNTYVLLWAEDGRGITYSIGRVKLVLKSLTTITGPRWTVHKHHHRAFQKGWLPDSKWTSDNII